MTVINTVAIEVAKGDITEQDLDAIVNAANNELIHGAGVAGAISRAGGYTIQAESDRIGTIQIGDAVATRAGKLKAKWVIHAASMRLGHPTSEKALGTAVFSALHVADQLKIKSIAFPAIGAGHGRMKAETSAEIMRNCVLTYCNAAPQLELIRFVLWDEAAFQVFSRLVWNSSI